jgi:hypothetical protein
MVLSEQEMQIDTLRYDLDLTDKYQQQVFDRQIAEEQKHSSFVSDRSVIDVLAYSAQHARILPQLVQNSAMKSRLSILREPGSLLFFVKPSHATLKADGVRESLNWDGVVAIDAMIKFMFNMWDLPFIQINMDNMQERINLVDNTIGMLK